MVECEPMHAFVLSNSNSKPQRRIKKPKVIVTITEIVDKWKRMLMFDISVTSFIEPLTQAGCAVDVQILQHLLGMCFVYVTILS